jgi:medium-chain acyl-[acyl-carrier-protein] hydrolase
MTMPLQPDGRWLQAWNPRPQARLRLICLPPAGAGASFYRDLLPGLPPDVELLAVRLPGREGRFSEPALTGYQQAGAALHAALRHQFTRPYALFGHSMGALLAYGVALAARQHGDPAPTRLFVSGTTGPGIPRRRTGRQDWPDQELVADLRKLGGTAEGVLNDPELLSLILPVLRADYRLCDSFESSPAFTLGTEPPLDCPVSVLGGDEDDCTPAELAHWAAVTRGGAIRRSFPGGHFYLRHPSAAAVGAAVAGDLAAPVV